MNDYYLNLALPIKYMHFPWCCRRFLFRLVYTLLMMQDINSDLSIKDALAREEKFFRTQPVCCSRVCFLLFGFSVTILFSILMEFVCPFLGISWSYSVLRNTAISKEAKPGMVLIEMPILVQLLYCDSKLIPFIWFQILVQHIKTVLPGLKSRISSQLTAAAKELAIYGDPVDSKVCFTLVFFWTK